MKETLETNARTSDVFQSENLSAKMVSLQTILESDAALTLIPMLGLVDSVCMYSRLTKQCHKRLQEYLLHHKTNSSNGTPFRSSWQVFTNFLDAFRRCAHALGCATISSEGSALLEKAHGNLDPLRQKGLVKDINQLNTAMYTHWNSRPLVPHKGIFHHVASCILNENGAYKRALTEDVQFWNSSRIHGEFIVLFDRPDGTIVVSKDCQNVYLVLGSGQSMGQVCNVGFHDGDFYKKPTYSPPTLHGPIVGVTVHATLLNWQGMMLFEITKAITSNMKMKQALKAYIGAVDKLTLVSELKKREGSLQVTPLPKIDTKEVEWWKSTHPEELEDIRNAELRGSHAIIFQRLGVTEEDNPGHVVKVVMPDDESFPLYCQLQDLTPTIGEYLTMADLAVKVCGKPTVFGIDELSVFETLGAVLDGTGVKVSYFSPPSIEAATVKAITNPYTRLSCAICGLRRQSDGTELLRCSRCKNEFYCSKEHQKQAWKRHKLFCTEV